MPDLFRIPSASTVARKERHPPREIGGIPESEWLCVDDILKIAKIDKAKDGVPPKIRRHYAAPYAYSYRGLLYRQWWQFLTKTDDEGEEILNQNDIKRVAVGYSKNWNPTNQVRVRAKDRKQFVNTVVASIPDNPLSQKKDRRILRPDLSNYKHQCAYCWKKWVRKDNRDTHEKSCVNKSDRQRDTLYRPRDFIQFRAIIESAHKNGLTLQAICELIKEVHGIRASPWVLESRMRSWGLHKEPDPALFFSEIKSAYHRGLTYSEIQKLLQDKHGANIGATVLEQHILGWGLCQKPSRRVVEERKLVVAEPEHTKAASSKSSNQNAQALFPTAPNQDEIALARQPSIATKAIARYDNEALLALPLGTGQNLTNLQIIQLRQLRPAERHTRASEVFDKYGRIYSKYKSLLNCEDPLARASPKTTAAPVIQATRASKRARAPEDSETPVTQATPAKRARKGKNSKKPTTLEIIEIGNAKLAKRIADRKISLKEPPIGPNFSIRKNQKASNHIPGVLSLTDAVDIDKDQDGPWAGWKALPIYAPAPHVTLDWTNAREDLYRKYESTRNIRQTIQRLERLHYHLLRNDSQAWTDRANGKGAVERAAKLARLQNAAAHCRSVLRETKLERVMTEGIDKLINDKANHKEVLDSLMPDQHAPAQVRKLPNESLLDRETHLSQFAKTVLEEIDPEHFLSNYLCFLNVKMRLPQNSSLNWKYQSTRGAPSQVLQPLDLLHDNLFHAGAFFGILKQEALAEGTFQGLADVVWRRVIAALAVCYGCTSEPAFFLSTIENLLDDLSSAFGCRAGVYSDTVSSTLGIESNNKTAIDVPDEVALTKSHRARMLMAELRVFVHGCAICAILLTWKSHLRRGPSAERQMEIFECLLRWNNKCASCGGTLLLPETGTSTIPTSALFRVGMVDVRVGDYLTRSQVSTNRGDVYRCFSPLIGVEWHRGSQDWGDEFGPFFHYFAFLYHPHCKPSREKEVLLVA